MIVHAPNIHQGGGKVLLLALTTNSPLPILFHHDSRLSDLPDLPIGSHSTAFAPSILSRLIAELCLMRRARVGQVVLCMGNLPPLFPNRGNCLVFLQNCFLADQDLDTSRFSRMVRLRIAIERFWLRRFHRNCRFVVQSESMALALYKTVGISASVVPFISSPESSYPVNTGQSKHCPQFDFIYPASGEPHKNHDTLFAAWVILAQQGIFPSLRLTLDNLTFSRFQPTIEKHNLQVINAPYASSELESAFRSARALLFPSLCESFGLPLKEAQNFGLAVLASERDFVRDQINPEQSFDPTSALSLARAVRRYLEVPSVTPQLLTPAEFWSVVLNDA